MQHTLTDQDKSWLYSVSPRIFDIVTEMEKTIEQAKTPDMDEQTRYEHCTAGNLLRENLRMANELSQYETRHVGLLAEIDSLKSQGPFTVQDGMVYCEDGGVMFNPAFPDGIAEKLNAMQATIDRLRKSTGGQ